MSENGMECKINCYEESKCSEWKSVGELSGRIDLPDRNAVCNSILLGELKKRQRALEWVQYRKVLAERYIVGIVG